MHTAVKAVQNYVGGEWTNGAAQDEATILDPATNEAIATVPRATPEDVDAAVSAARAALDGPWGSIPPAGRAKLLRALAGLVEANAGDLAELESRNVGKPIREAMALDIPGVAYCLDYFASWAGKEYGDTIPHSMMPVLNYTVREPVGVVGAIVPWNFPLAIATWKIAPALATGNTVVAKPAELTPLSLLRLCELAEEAGFPPGVLNVLSGPGSQVGNALATHPGVAKIAFTGSTEVGRQIMAAAAPTLKKLTLECGGKSPNIVFADADLDRAAEATLFGIFANQGEVCAAGSRLLIETSIHDAFVERLVQRAAELRIGDPKDPETQVGPLISRSHLATVTGYIEAGSSEGAQLAVGGSKPDVNGLDGNFIEPTIFTGVSNDMRIAQEEIFGPVLSVIPFEGDAEAVAIANDTMYGLVANVHTNDVRRAHTVAAGLQCGTVFVNLPPIPFTEAPIGGYKQTGVGKDLGRQALDEYLLTKSIVVDMAAPGEHFRWYEGG